MSSIIGTIPRYDVSRMDEPLPLGPEGLQHGQLRNGMTYYVRHCSKPENRAALKLVVRVGSLVEEENERGVAHIIEHLAFNASEAHREHEVVRALEAIGCAFGPCQNAYTALEETVYELLVPTDDAALLPKAFGILAEFAFRIRCGDEDLRRERGPVMQELRESRGAAGRAAEAHWRLMLQGARHAERLPIGKAEVIEGVPAAVVHAFYQRWYHPRHMAIVAAGDFKASGDVLETIRDIFGDVGAEAPAPPPLPVFPWVPHSTPRAQVLVDRESPQATFTVSFKTNANAMDTPAEYLRHLQGEVLHMLINRRFEAACRGASDCPYYAAQATRETLVSGCAAHAFVGIPLPGRMLQALEAVLTEVARLRVHGFTDKELEITKAQYMSEVATLYVERDQEQAGDAAGEYARHFTSGELVVGAAAEASLSVTLMERVARGDLEALLATLVPSASCVVKAVDYAAGVRDEQLLEVLDRVAAAEAAGEVASRPQEAPPERLLPGEPAAGTVTGERALEALGGTELSLSNGMRLSYRCSTLLDDQILLTGFAVGGLTEVSLAKVRSAHLAPTLAGELGIFGVKPHLLADYLAGRRVALAADESLYWRKLSGQVSPADLQTACELIHKLFIHEVVPVEAELAATLAYTRDAIAAARRDPMSRFADEVRRTNYGTSPLLRPLTEADLAALDVGFACSHFSAAFRDPAEFTLCFVGNLDEGKLRELVTRYLASIPRPEGAPAAADARRPLGDVAPLEVAMPSSRVRRRVAITMAEPMAQVQVTFPVQINQDDAPREGLWLSLACRLIEQRVLRMLRFDGGQVYTAAASASFALEAPSRRGTLRGDVAVQFAAAPGAGEAAAEAVVAEVAALQRDGPTEAEVATALTLDQREHETAVQQNEWWLEMMATSYQSRLFRDMGSADAVFARRMAARADVRGAATAAAVRDALRRLLPNPVTLRHTVVLTTDDTLWTRAAAALHSYAAAAIAAVSSILLVSVLLWRRRPR